jgi:hypothetical protein
VVHQLNQFDSSNSSHTETAGLPVAPTAYPDEGMIVLVPIGGGAFDSLLDPGPGRSLALLRLGAQHLPPRLDRVEISGKGGLKDELPAGMKRAEQQRVRRAAGIEIVPPPALPEGPAIA